MIKIDDGGSAFPGTQYASGISPSGHSVGMSLRDYFAAKAMQGLLAAQVHGFNDRPAKGPFASMAYEMADAMLSARKSSKTEQQQPQGWIEWNGGECPVPEGVSFFVRFRDGEEFDVGTGEGLIWKHDGTIGDIIAYRIVSNGDSK